MPRGTFLDLPQKLPIQNVVPSLFIVVTSVGPTTWAFSSIHRPVQHPPDETAWLSAFPVEPVTDFVGFLDRFNFSHSRFSRQTRRRSS